MPVVLHITHHWGGGTEQHVQEIADYLRDVVMPVVLHSTSDGHVTLSVPGEPDRCYRPREDFDGLVAELRRLGVARVHVHQLFTVPVDVRRLIAELGVAFDFTVHDYHTLCPRVHFKTRDGAYCEEPGPQGCATCLHDWHQADERDIVAYRARYEWVFREARHVICPSRDVAARVLRHRRDTPLVVAPHPRPGRHHPVVSAVRITETEPLRIAVLGSISAFKGATRVLASARIVEEAGLPLRIEVIGTIEGTAPPGLAVSGRYPTGELQAMLRERRPHLLWYPAQVPETYSYVLSEGLEAGLPVLVPRLGAFPERVASRPWSWIADWALSPRDAVALLMDIRSHFVSGRPPAAPRDAAVYDVPAVNAGFYRSDYLAALP